MPKPFPHHFRVRLDRAGPQGGTLSAPPRPEIVAGSPPEFGGTDAHWSPEHLLLGSLSLCYELTVQVLARLKKVAVSEFQAETEGTVEKTREGLRFTRITIHPEVRVPPGQDPRAVEALLQSAKRHCLVSNSISAEVEVEGRVVEAR